jgi:AcrR family transcriptional regulator
LDHVTVDEISAAAGVSKRTFFNYFDSKERCVVDAPPGTWQRLATALDARPVGEPPLESLRAASRTVITEMAPGLQQLAVLVHANPALMQRHLASFAEFHHVIVDWAARRTRLDPLTEYQPELFASIAGTALQVAVNRCGVGPDHELSDVLRSPNKMIMW